MAKEKPDTTGASDGRQSGGTTLKQEILSWIEVIVVAVVLALFIDGVIIINATIPSGSMETTIMTGDRVLGLRLTYKFSDPERGDIVVFNYPIDQALGKNTKYIKRIIGLPGETVEIRDGEIYIDGSDTPLEEDYLHEEWVVANDGFTFEIPDGYYLMLGDNRNNSSDSRYWATLAVKYGLASSVEEAVEMNLCYVAKDEILGKAYIRYWPLTKISSLY